MHAYGVREVEKLLGLPRSVVRALVDAGFVAPERGPRNAWRFSFQDLIVLRTARALRAANVPKRRILRALTELRRRLPESMPLSGLSIGAVADQVVVREGGERWQAESGQYLLSFEGDPDAGALRILEAARPDERAPHAADAATDYDDDATGEENAEAAVRAYQRALMNDPTRPDARINLGRLLHELGRYDEAERVYRGADAELAADPLLQYNLGVLLDDMERKSEAVLAYETALQGDPDFADCHYNLALLYEELNEPRSALRHLAQYHRLQRRGD